MVWLRVPVRLARWRVWPAWVEAAMSFLSLLSTGRHVSFTGGAFASGPGMNFLAHARQM